MIVINDNEIVLKVLQGETDEFRHLVAKYQQPLFNYAFRHTRDVDLAKDVTQQVFLKTYEKLKSFDTKRKFFSWIFRITVNETINFMKYNRKYLPIDTMKNIPDAESQTETENKEIKDRVQKAIMRLDHKYRTLILLKHFEDYSYSEIADILEIPEKKVKSRLFTAREKLSKLLQRELLR